MSLIILIMIVIIMIIIKDGAYLFSVKLLHDESSRGVKGGRHVRMTILLPYLSRLSRGNVGASTSYNPMGLHGLLQC
jgi:hypothetical protein